MSTRIRGIAVVVFAALVVACVAAFGFSFEALVDALACGVLVVVSVTDLERRIVPNRIIVPALVVALVVQTIRDPSVEWVVASLGAGGFYLPRGARSTRPASAWATSSSRHSSEPGSALP